MPLPKSSFLENKVSQFATQVNNALMHSSYDKTKEEKVVILTTVDDTRLFFFDEIQFEHPTSNTHRRDDIREVKMQQLLRPKYVSDTKPWIKMSGTQR